MSYVPIAAQQGINGRVNGAPGAGEKTARIVSETRRGAPTKGARGHATPDPDAFPLIVHSHLCWDWVWQRPQQFLSRLSARHKILFLETVGPDPQLAAPY